LVDDDPDNLELLTELIRRAGHEVRTAMDADSALLALEEFRPQVAVVDIGLPSMNGYELAAQIRKRAPCRLLALSGYGAETAPSDNAVSSFDDHFVKPVNISVLLTAIEAAPSTPSPSE
jgi:DNA-binding response OmpR family regulator